MSENTTPENTPAPSPADEGSGRFAAYDKTYQRFVGGVHTSKAKAREAAKNAGSKSFEVREV